MSQLLLSGVAFRNPGAPGLLIRQIDLTLSPGLYYLYGANGSGKTTLLKGLAGIQSPAEGSVRLLHDNQTLGVAAYKPYMGYCPQQIALHDQLNVMQYLRYVARMRLIPEKLIGPRITELLDQFGLSAHRTDNSGLLSVGQKKTLMLAQAMLADPELLLLDEPLAHADIEEQQRLREWMAEEGERRIIIASHQPSERRIEHSCHLLFLVNGRLYGPYAPETLLARLHNRIVSFRLPGSNWKSHMDALDELDAGGVRVLSVAGLQDYAIVRLFVRDIGRLKELQGFADLTYTSEAPTSEDLFMSFGMLIE